MAETLGVAEAKRRFAELIERVSRGERFVVARHGRPVLSLCPPDAGGVEPVTFTGFASVAGFLSDWTDADIDDMVGHIYAERRRAKDRPAPTFD